MGYQMKYFVFLLIFTFLWNNVPAQAVPGQSGSHQGAAYEIYALKYADVRIRDRLSVLALGAPEDALFDPVFTFWLIREPGGRNILVDAGFINDMAVFRWYRIRDYIRPDSVLQRIGVAPGDITDIILTHPHKDHIDGIDLFPEARIWMQKDDFQYFVGDAWQEGRNGDGYLKRDVRKVIEANLDGRLVLIDGEQEIMPGIRVCTGSRHSYNSQYVVVSSNGERTVIASDNASTYFNIEHEVSVPSYATYDTAAYVQQIRRMKTFVTDPKYILPGHDDLLFSKFPEVAEWIVRVR